MGIYFGAFVVFVLGIGAFFMFGGNDDSQFIIYNCKKVLQGFDCSLELPVRVEFGDIKFNSFCENLNDCSEVLYSNLNCEMPFTEGNPETINNYDFEITARCTF